MALDIIAVSCSIESKLLSGFKIQDVKSQSGYKNTIERFKLKGSNMMCNNIKKHQKLKTAAKILLMQETNGLKKYYKR